MPHHVANSLPQSNVYRVYPNRAFNLTARKLIRIVEVTRQRMEKLADAGPISEQFSVTFANSKEMTLSRVEDALALDNTVKNRIVEFEYSVWVGSTEDKGHWINVHYDATSASVPVRIAAKSHDLIWMDEAVGAVEEQVERTLQSSFGLASLGGGDVFIAGVTAVIAMLVSIFTAVAGRGASNKLGLPPGKVQELVEVARVAESESEKLNFVYSYLAASLEPQPSPTSLFFQYASELRTYMIGVPLLLALFAAFAALYWCSPRRIFVWGDYEEHYNKLVDRRKFLWYGVVAALVIGVLGNFFILGVSPSLAAK